MLARPTLTCIETVATMTAMALLAALNPDQQGLAYKEILSVVGTERFPCLEDKPHLPYTSAFVDECMRLLPVIPIGEFLAAYQWLLTWTRYTT